MNELCSVRRADASSSSSLDHLETNDDPLAVQSRAQHRIHRPHWRSRARIIDVLAGAEDAIGAKRIERMGQCCRCPIVGCSSDGEFSVALNRCRDRLCPLCASFRAREAADRIQQRTQSMTAPRFLTLTLREDGEPLRCRMERLAESFRKLRQRGEWRDHVRGGIYAIQVTRGSDGAGWHVHLHVVWDGRFWEQRSISRMWEEVTGDSPVVDVRAVVDRAQAAKYISRYVAHTDSVAGWSDDAIIEYAIAMRGRRTLHTFGSMHGASVDEAKNDEPPNVQRGVLSIGVLLDRAGRGDHDAQCVHEYLCRAGRAWRRWLSDRDDRYGSPPNEPLEEWERERAREAFERICADVYDHRSDETRVRDERKAERERRRQRRRHDARRQRRMDYE